MGNFLPEPGGAIWSSVYPVAVEMGAGEELLYWDLGGDTQGLVYYVDHEGPWHCLRFKSMQDCIAHFLTVRDPLSRLWDGVAVPNRYPTVAEFHADEDSLRAFLAAFPGHWWVHDLRRVVIGAGFTYSEKGPDAFTRYRDDPLWVQGRPKGIWQRLTGKW
jgi:hypothetical protein